MSKHPMWLRRGIALTLALVMTASLSVSALAAPSVEEAGEDTVLSQTQPDSDSQVPAEGPEGLENGSQAADSLPMIPLEPAEQASSDTAAETEEDIKLTAPGSGLRFDSEEGEYGELSMLQQTRRGQKIAVLASLCPLSRRVCGSFSLLLSFE